MKDLTTISQQLKNPVWWCDASSHSTLTELVANYMNGKLPFPVSTKQDVPAFDPTANQHPMIDYYGTNTAVITISGTILPSASQLQQMLFNVTSLEDLKTAVKMVGVNDAIQNVIFNVNSGGGNGTGVPEATDLIAELSEIKDTYAYTNTMAGSAAYFLICPCSTILMSSSALVGSIGTYFYTVDNSVQMANQGLKPVLIAAGDYKGAGLDGVSLNDKQLAWWNNYVTQQNDIFLSYVSSNRDVSTDSMQGQLFTSQDAVSAGLVDGIVDDLNDLIDTLTASEDNT